MKKILALLLSLVMVMGLFAACSGSEDKKPEETTTAPTQESTEPSEEITEPSEEITDPVVADSNESTKILENIWAQVGEENQFFVMGGNVENFVDGKPGNYNMEYKENLNFNLLVPAEQLANIDEAGFMQHGMNANNFTAGVVHVTGHVTAFAAAMQSAIQNNQWMCGFPETLVIAAINDSYVLVSFGINDAMNPFIAGLNAAYADANILYNEAIGG